MRIRPTAVLLAFLTGSLAAQPAPPPKVQWFPAAAAASAKPWQALVDRATLALGRQHLAAGTDTQPAAHDRDAVYCVLGGKAKLTADGATRDVGPGDCVFVAAATPHRFHDVAADLDAVVLHSAARPSTGGMVEGPVPTEQTAYPETSPRGATRIFYWFGTHSAGQVAIDHGTPLWNAGHERFLAKRSEEHTSETPVTL